MAAPAGGAKLDSGYCNVTVTHAKCAVQTAIR
jgi:hypothetical protein